MFVSLFPVCFRYLACEFVAVLLVGSALTSGLAEAVAGLSKEEGHVWEFVPFPYPLPFASHSVQQDQGTLFSLLPTLPGDCACL